MISMRLIEPGGGVGLPLTAPLWAHVSRHYFSLATLGISLTRSHKS